MVDSTQEVRQVQSRVSKKWEESLAESFRLPDLKRHPLRLETRGRYNDDDIGARLHAVRDNLHHCVAPPNVLSVEEVFYPKVPKCDGDLLRPSIVD